MSWFISPPSVCVFNEPYLYADQQIKSIRYRLLSVTWKKKPHVIGSNSWESGVANYSVVLVNETHKVHSQQVFYLAKLRILLVLALTSNFFISSTTFDVEKFSDNIVWSAIIFKIITRRFFVEMHYTKALEADYLDATIFTALQNNWAHPWGDGDILAFLTG